MPIQRSLLKKVKDRGTKVVAQCPACAEAGGDSKGVHLVVYPDGRFGCTASRDKAHRRRIAELVGEPNRQTKPWKLTLRGVEVMAGGEPTTTALNSLARSVVARLKPSGNTPSETSEKPDVETTTDVTDTLLPLTRIETFASYSTKHIGTISLATPSETSEDIVALMHAAFGGKATTYTPDSLLPAHVMDCLRNWPAVRLHPAWAETLPPPRRVLGWDRSGRRVYAKQ